MSTLCPFLTRTDIQTWASFGPPAYSKPSTEEEALLRKQRKQSRTQFKKSILVECNPNDKDASSKILEQELDRLATPLWNNRRDAKNDSNRNKKEEAVEEFPTYDLPDYQKDNGHPDNILDHRSQGGPLLQYLWAPPDNPIHGQSLYLGGEVGSDGNIYCIPGHATRVLQINTTANTIQPIGPELVTGNGRQYKWLRGLVIGDIIYGLPCHADSILRIDVATRTISQIDIPYDDLYSHDPLEATNQRYMKWKTHGGAISPIDHCIYAIPQSCLHVLKLDPSTEKISIVGPAFGGRCKWYGGIIGKQDGAIYGIPQNASGVLRITPNGVSTHGDFGAGQHNWHGGAAAPNGVIVSVPANADTVLCITPANTVNGEPTLELIGDGSFIQSGRHRRDKHYKYLGAMAGTNGKVYIFPCASERVLQVDTVNGIAKNVGSNLRDTGMELVHQNKWQNGLTCWQDECVYGISQAGHTLLRIDCANTTSDWDSPDPIVTTWKLPPPRIECRDKFEGGVYTAAGVMYTVPNNHKGVLRIEPIVIGQAKKNKDRSYVLQNKAIR